MAMIYSPGLTMVNAFSYTKPNINLSSTTIGGKGHSFLFKFKVFAMGHDETRVIKSVIF